MQKFVIPALISAIINYFYGGTIKSLVLSFVFFTFITTVLEFIIKSKRFILLIPTIIGIIVLGSILRPYLELINYKMVSKEEIKFYYHLDKQLSYIMAIESKLPVYRKKSEKLISEVHNTDVLVIFKDTEMARRDSHLKNGQNGFYSNNIITIRTGSLIQRVSNGNQVIYDSPDPVGTFYHEYTHRKIGLLNARNLPLWFTEGIAQYLAHSISGIKPDTRDILPFKVISKDDNWSVYPMNSLYNSGELFITRIVNIYGEEKLKNVIDYLAKGNDFHIAIEKGLNLAYSEFEGKM